MPKISLVIITKNEEEYIRECILSAKDVVDEIIVLDEFSTDKTKDIVLKLGAAYFSEKFRGFGEQKRRTVELTSHDWILALDADERLSGELKNSIIHWKKKPSDYQGFSFNRLNYYCGKPIKYCGWYPDRKIRFWNKKHGNWNKNKVHESVEMKEGTTEGILAGDLIHFTITSIEDHINRTNRYTSLQAEKHLQKSNFIIYLKLIFSPIFSFFKIYFLKLGILDGYHGFLIAKISAMGQFWVYAKALNKKKEG
ncbi:MAG: glycosyltransferase involved in cell wall biosynthesis [Maribacter sp.]|jgi:glycosyltransferase involved in cell wall biosynthesis